MAADWKTKHGNYTKMYGAVNYEDAVVLDIGADEGSTADFFFAQGARKVVASEKVPEQAARLVEKAVKEHRLVPVGEMTAPRDVTEWLLTYRPTVAKVDVEGAEEYLLRADPTAMSVPRTWLIETHSTRIHALLWALFEHLGYRVSIADEWAFNEQVKVLRADAQEFPTRVLTTADYVRMIRSGEPFAQANYGDGEWGCLMGHNGANCNGEPYNVTIRDALRHTILSPNGHLCGTNPGWKLQREVEGWVAFYDCATSVPWVYKETLANASVHGEFAPVLSALRCRPLVVVGPGYLAQLPSEHFGAVQLVEVADDGTAWKSVEATCEEVKRVVADIWVKAQGQALVLFASGMASNMMIYRLWGDVSFRAYAASLLDVGATLDPYAGRMTRNAYRKPEFADAMRRNLCA